LERAFLNHLGYVWVYVESLVHTAFLGEGTDYDARALSWSVFDGVKIIPFFLILFLGWFPQFHEVARA